MKTEITEYAEGYPVSIQENSNESLVIVAYNQAGHDATEVDLVDVIDWVKENKPELLNE